jgi:hypothetical protein
MAERLTILASVIFIVCWFLSGNFGATTLRFPGRFYSLPTEEGMVVKGQEKDQIVWRINEILRNKK